MDFYKHISGEFSNFDNLVHFTTTSILIAFHILASGTTSRNVNQKFMKIK